MQGDSSSGLVRTLRRGAHDHSARLHLTTRRPERPLPRHVCDELLANVPLSRTLCLQVDAAGVARIRQSSLAINVVVMPKMRNIAGVVGLLLTRFVPRPVRDMFALGVKKEACLKSVR